jgi:isochorismate hydrolase
MYHYDPSQALEELQEEALLPHPVKLRDMILRNQLGPQEAQLLNHDFQEYLTRFGEAQKLARTILEKLSAGQRKAASL